MNTHPDNRHAPDTPAPQPAAARLPALSPEDRNLLHNFIALGEDPVALARHCGVDYLDVVDFTSRPEVAAWIAHIRALRLHLRRELALTALENLLKSAEDPIEIRRTATTILRATDPARPRKQSRSSADHADRTADTAARTDQATQHETHTPAVNTQHASNTSPPSDPSDPSIPPTSAHSHLDDIHPHDEDPDDDVDDDDDDDDDDDIDDDFDDQHADRTLSTPAPPPSITSSPAPSSDPRNTPSASARQRDAPH